MKDKNGKVQELRDYQKECVKIINCQITGSYIIIMATGLGKTFIFTHIDRHGKVLILSHRDELVRQPLEQYDFPCGVEKADESSNGEEVVSASVQSLVNRLKRFAPDEFDTIIVDEAHHAVAPSYRKILDHFKPRLVLGFTATPNRSDGVGLGEVFSQILFKRDIVFGMKNKYLAKMYPYSINVEYDISGVERKQDDFDQEQLAKCMDNPIINGKIALAYKNMAKGPTLIFASSVQYAKSLAKLIDGAVVVTRQTKNRQEIIEKYANGEINCLINYAVFTEGTNLPMIETVIIARPTCNTLLYTQMVGRGLRTDDGNKKMILLDCVGNAGKHNLCSVITLLGITYLPRSVTPVKLCGKKLLEINEIIHEEMNRAVSLEDMIIKATPINLFEEETGYDAKKIFYNVMPNGEMLSSLGYNNLLRIAAPDLTGKSHAEIYDKDSVIWKSDTMPLKELFNSVKKYLWAEFKSQCRYWSLKYGCDWRNNGVTKAQIELINDLIMEDNEDGIDIGDLSGLTCGQASDIITTLKFKKMMKMIKP